MTRYHVDGQTFDTHEELLAYLKAREPLPADELLDTTSIRTTRLRSTT